MRKLYRLLLRCFPAEIRQRWSSAMEEAFEAQYSEESGGSRRMRFAVVTAAATVKAGIGAHLEQLRTDLAHGLRRLRTRPGPALTVVLTLAAGIGAATTLFSVLNGVLLRPLPYPEPDRLVRLWVDRPAAESGRSWFSEGEYHVLQRRNRSFSSLTASWDSRTVTLGGVVGPVTVTAARVSADFLATMGVSPRLGRGITEAEDRPGSDDVVLISHRLWRSQFGGDVGVLDRPITVDGNPRRIVGILPSGFDFPTAGTDVWVPLALNRVDVSYQGGQYLSVTGRLQPETSLQKANAELATLSDQITTERKTRYPGLRSYAVELHEDRVGDSRKVLLLLMGGSLVLLATAISNCAGLLSNQAIGRRREVALRQALGASRLRIARQLLTESLLLATAGGLAGVVGGLSLLRLIRTLPATVLPRLVDLQLDWRVWLFALVVTTAAGLIAGVLPARIENGTATTLRSASRGSVTGGGLLSGRGPVTAQIALSFLLVVFAGLVTRSLLELARVDPGIRTDGLVSAGVSLPPSRYANDVAIENFWRDVRARTLAIGGVADVAALQPLPFSGERATGYAWAEGVDVRPDILPPSLDFVRALPGVFETLGVPLLEGRTFRSADASAGADVAVVSHSLAVALWPHESPVGKRFKLGRQVDDSVPWRTVVGVVADIKMRDLREAGRRTAYFPRPSRRMSLVVRARGDSAALLAPLRKAVQEVDPGLALDAAGSMESRLAEALARERLSSRIIVGFSMTALLLAFVGVYGLINYEVTCSYHDLGVRMALGASPAGLRRSVLGRSCRLAGAGLAIGITLALAGGRVVSALLFGVTATDPLTWGVAAGLLMGTAVAAAALPAMRATRVDPLVALRSD